MNRLPDYLDYKMKIMFVGYNPGVKSAEIAHHYGGKGNQFYKLLYDAGLTTRLYSPAEDHLLINYGYGLTNLVSRPSRSSSDLSAGEMEEGAGILRNKISKYQPRIVCFLGKEIYRRYTGLKSSVPVDYGPVLPAAEDTNLQIIMEFIAPNPSGRSTVSYSIKLDVFKKLKEYMNTV